MPVEKIRKSYLQKSHFIPLNQLTISAFLYHLLSSYFCFLQHCISLYSHNWTRSFKRHPNCLALSCFGKSSLSWGTSSRSPDPGWASGSRTGQWQPCHPLRPYKKVYDCGVPCTAWEPSCSFPKKSMSFDKFFTFSKQPGWIFVTWNREHLLTEWAAVYRVAQSRTRLKWLSRSSSSNWLLWRRQLDAWENSPFSLTCSVSNG